jgi:hypothetical protein
MELLENPEILTSYIQSVSRGKVNILGGYCIGHYKQKSLYEHLSFSELFPRYSNLNVNGKTAEPHASDSGAAWREGRTLLGAQTKPMYSQMLYLGYCSE